MYCWNKICGDGCCEANRYQKGAKSEKDESFFCSQLIARAYQKAGFFDTSLDEAMDASFFLPKDFSADPHNNVQTYGMPKGWRYQLGDEIKIVPGGLPKGGGVGEMNPAAGTKPRVTNIIGS